MFLFEGKGNTWRHLFSRFPRIMDPGGETLGSLTRPGKGRMIDPHGSTPFPRSIIFPLAFVYDEVSSNRALQHVTLFFSSNE